MGALPDAQRERSGVIVGDDRAMTSRRGTPLIPIEPQGGAHVIATHDRIIARKRMHYESITGVGVEQDGETTIGATMAGSWSQHAVAADRLAAEGERNRTDIEHGYARRLRASEASASRSAIHAASACSLITRRVPAATSRGALPRLRRLT
jgi:hypothetical protein